MKKEESNKLCSESVDRAIASVKDGIVVVYHDHLSCDAFRVYVRKDGETIKPEKRFRYGWSDEKKNYEILEEEFARWDYNYGDCREVNMMTWPPFFRSFIYSRLDRIKRNASESESRPFSLTMIE